MDWLLLQLCVHLKAKKLVISLLLGVVEREWQNASNGGDKNWIHSLMGCVYNSSNEWEPVCELLHVMCPCWMRIVFLAGLEMRNHTWEWALYKPFPNWILLDFVKTKHTKMASWLGFGPLSDGSSNWMPIDCQRWIQRVCAVVFVPTLVLPYLVEPMTSLLFMILVVFGALILGLASLQKGRQLL